MEIFRIAKDLKRRTLPWVKNNIEPAIILPMSEHRDEEIIGSRNSGKSLQLPDLTTPDILYIGISAAELRPEFYKNLTAIRGLRATELRSSHCGVGRD